MAFIIPFLGLHGIFLELLQLAAQIYNHASLL